MTEQKKFDDAISKLEAAKYGVEVRDATVDALKCCYKGIANVNSKEFYEALIRAADEGYVSKPDSEIDGNRIEEKTISMTKLSQEILDRFKSLESMVTDLNGQLEKKNKEELSKLPISKQLADAQQINLSIRDTMTKVRANVEEYRRQVEQVKEQASTMKSLGDNIQATTRSHKSLDTSFKELKSDYDRMVTSFQERLTSLERASELSKKIQNTFEQIQTEQQTLSTAVERQGKTIAKLSGSYGTLLERQGTNTTTISSHNDRIDGLSSFSSKLRERIDNLEVFKETVEEEKEVTGKRFISIESLITCFNNKDTDIRIRIKNLEDSIRGCMTDVSVLSKDLSTMSLNIPVMNKAVISVEALEKRMSELQTSSSNHTEEKYKQIVEDVQNLKRENENLRATVNTNVNEEYEQLAKDVQMLRKENEDFRATVNASLEHILSLIGERMLGVG